MNDLSGELGGLYTKTMQDLMVSKTTKYGLACDIVIFDTIRNGDRTKQLTSRYNILWYLDLCICYNMGFEPGLCYNNKRYEVIIIIFTAYIVPHIRWDWVDLNNLAVRFLI